MDRTLVSITRWPEGWGEAERVEALVRALGQDPTDARLVARRPPPTIALAMETPDAASGLAALEQFGVSAAGPRLSEIESIPRARPARRLIEGEGTFAVEMWRERGVAFRFDEVVLIVRAGVRQERRSVAIRPRDPRLQHPMGAGTPGEVEVTREVKRRSSEVIDLHLRRAEKRARLRIDGSKFNFDVLAGGRGYSDLDNANRLAALLTERSPGAGLDVNFSGFRGEIRVGRTGSASTWATHAMRDEWSAFEFYSAWTLLIHEATMGRERRA